jgi:hypothetical protein
VSHRLLVGSRPADLREALPVNARGGVRWWRVIASGFVAMLVVGEPQLDDELASFQP